MPHPHQNNYCIAIKTAWNKTLGTGHVQRMCSLLWYLNEVKNINTYLVPDGPSGLFPNELSKYLKEEINFSPDIIIRDMRDSSEKEIALLKKTGHVLVIDDNGPGRKIADYTTDILPNPEAPANALEITKFLYGYNFIKSLKQLKNKAIKKDIDFSIYPGNSSSPEYLESLILLLPKGSSYAVLKNEESYIYKNGQKIPAQGLSYAEMILSSRALLSHFGITLYEGFISKCKIYTINPGAYHSKLSDMAKNYLKLENLGEYKNLNKDRAKLILRKAFPNTSDGTIKSEDIYNDIISNMENFCEYITGLIEEGKGYPKST